MLDKKYLIRIPENVDYIYKSDLNILVLKGPNGLKYIKLKLKINSNIDNYLYVTSEFYSILSQHYKKKIKSCRRLEVSKIKNCIIELSQLHYYRLDLIGVGYKVFLQKKQDLLVLKLGYSHDIYIKVPVYLNVVCPNPTVIFISGHSRDLISSFIDLIRSFRKPEVYKGKGILREYEKITLKEGKSTKN